MKFGYFDDAAREYVITTPETPLPWINYLGSDAFFSLISNTGGGYCFYRDAKLRRLIRYRYNQAGGDLGGRFTYIRDGDTVWSPAFLPAGTPLDAYKCRHGMGYTVFESSKGGVKAEQTLLVPRGERCEVHRLKVTNASDAQKSLKIYGAVEFCMWNAVDDNTNFQRNLNIGEVEILPGVIYHKTEYRERRNHYAWYSVNVPTAGFDTQREEFLGRFGTWQAPKQVLAGGNASSEAHGWSPIACHRIDVTLKPGESKDMVFVLGYGENAKEDKFIAPGVIRKDEAEAVIARYADGAAVDAAMATLAGYWDGLLSGFHIASDEPRLDRMVNIWNQYQCMVTFNLSRSASYYESGTGRGMGFRDSCQDLLGFMHMIPDRARERIIDIASVQWEDGSTYHQYQPLTKKGNNEIGSGFNDDPLWLVACTAAYIRETGDSSILGHPTPFDNKPGSEQPLMEHLRRSIDHVIDNRGPHGLPLIGRADWNDCLNLNCFSETDGESFQTTANYESGIAESVFIAAMFVKYAREYADLCDRWGTKAEADRARAAAADMEKAVERDGWDGEWFLRAYDAFGNKVGTHETEEAQIFIEPQGFAVMAGIGRDNGMALKALDSTRDILFGPWGVELLHPVYTKYHVELGEITSYPGGYKENGSVFTHNNPWVGIAEAVMGRGNESFEVYTRICPAWVEANSEIRRTEPYVYCQTTAGRDAYRPGEAKNSWLSGTAAWTFVSVSQYILGLRPDYEGLLVDPCLPDAIDGFTADRRYRGCDYHITVKRGSDRGMTVDGAPVEGKCVAHVPGRTSCRVEVVI
ncbi:MAG: glycosyl transferase [Clostridia bacterium]|nr:glycosyl transferase [Clostridia bacterium]